MGQKRRFCFYGRGDFFVLQTLKFFGFIFFCGKLKHPPFGKPPLFYKAPPRQNNPPKCTLATSNLHPSIEFHRHLPSLSAPKSRDSLQPRRRFLPLPKQSLDFLRPQDARFPLRRKRFSGRAKGAAKGSCGETVVQKGVFGESVSSLHP